MTRVLCPPSLYPHLFARAYINFKNQDDIVLFRDRFDGYVFIDNRGMKITTSEVNERFAPSCSEALFLSAYCLETGQEYPAIVEFAPFQKTAKKKSKKKDSKCGTIIEGKDICPFRLRR